MNVHEKYSKKEMKKLGYRLNGVSNEMYQPYLIWYSKNMTVYIDKKTHKVEFIFRN
jgi:hypothetical protein